MYMFNNLLIKGKPISANLRSFIEFEVYLSEILFRSKNLEFSSRDCLDELIFLNSDYYLFLENNHDFM